MSNVFVPTDGNKILENIKRGYKKAKIQTRRRLYRQKHGKPAQWIKQVVLSTAINVVAALAPDALAAQPLNSSDDSSTNGVTPSRELLADNVIMNVADAYPLIREFSEDRGAVFAREVAEGMETSVNEVKSGIKAGRKTSTLRKMFGKDVHTRFYCAIGALKTIDNLSKNKGFFEYDFLLKCIENPHSCLSVIDGLTNAYGDECKTNNMRESIREEFNRNPNSVLVALIHSKSNSSSGRHLVIVTPTFAADTIVYKNGVQQGTVYALNSEVIKNVDEYFTGSLNRGNLYNLTDIGDDKLKELFYRGEIPISSLVNYHNERQASNNNDLAHKVDRTLFDLRRNSNSR